MKMKLQYKRWGGVDAFYKCDKCNGGMIVSMEEYPKEIDVDCYMCGIECLQPMSTVDVIATLC